ncbi:MAG: MnmC family methyltransferase [Candidatus Woesearchaeota archaeon]
MQEVITQDGTITYRNNDVDETYHSHSGAEAEAREKYAKQVQKYLNEKDEIVIYDACFGLGYNSAATIDLIQSKKLRIYCFENDIKILSKIPFLNANFQSYSKIKSFIHKFLTQKEPEQLSSNLELRMVHGDIKKRIKEKREKADYILYDPFSPTKQPDLWTKEIFKDLYSQMTEHAYLFTYSCARHARDNMRTAGFEVIDGPIIGRRSPSTIAIKKQNKNN